MRLSGRAFTAVVFAASIAGVSTPAAAQAEAPTATEPGAAQQQAWMQHRQEHRAAFSKRLHDVLNLRPDQDAALSGLIDALSPQPGDRMKAGDMRDMHQEMAGLTTPERLDRLAVRMADHQAVFQRRAAAIKRFYEALTPDQQRAFDALPGLMWPGSHLAFGGDRGMEGRGGPDGMAAAGA